ncbi:uncharacterized protein LOC130794547 [Actinidia eriantha]|uniref:uncharacterized protein LOC130794547 n=1 Tax=Actinidia eriantha TaxID=165200 RepID=UPI00258D2A60|nr:uncharacterized protein LOC130794547 [Actinidia eriantha]
MGNTLRCCLACVLPCGALDLIRIVHLNGYVEEITGPVTCQRGPQEQPQPRSQQALLSGRRPPDSHPIAGLRAQARHHLLPDSVVIAVGEEEKPRKPQEVLQEGKEVR